jgi:hypothetical protein
VTTIQQRAVANAVIMMTSAVGGVEVRDRRSFRAIVTPVTDLTTPRSPGNPGSVAFTTRKSNGIVTIQFEPFTATLAAPVRFISVRQSIGDLPPHVIDVPYVLKLNNVGRVGFVRIDPLDSSANLKFYLGPDDSVAGSAGDRFETNGGIIQWIENY